MVGKKIYITYLGLCKIVLPPFNFSFPSWLKACPSSCLCYTRADKPGMLWPSQKKVEMRKLQNFIIWYGPTKSQMYDVTINVKLNLK